MYFTIFGRFLESNNHKMNRIIFQKVTILEIV